MDFIRGHTTLPTETDVFFYQDGILQDPEEVVFTVFDLVSDPPNEIVVGVPAHPATRLSAGHYYARFEIPKLAAFGDYKVVFNYAMRDQQGNILSQAVEMPFNVVSEVAQPESPAVLRLIDILRKVLRDNNPDCYYRFAPPLKTGEIRGFTRETGHLWQNDELDTFLELASNEIKATPFGTAIGNYPSVGAKFEPAVIMTAAFYATFAEAVRWVSEEFQYDIDGVSLTIDRSSKFRDMADGFRSAAEAQLDLLQKSIRFTKGVKLTHSVSRGAILGPSIAHSPIHNFIQSRYKV
jgi:hypothetical protein